MCGIAKIIVIIFRFTILRLLLALNVTGSMFVFKLVKSGELEPDLFQEATPGMPGWENN